MKTAIDIRDIKGPIVYGWDSEVYWIFGLILVLLSGLLLLLFLRLKRSRKPPLIRPAHEIASEALIRLKERGPAEAGWIVEHHMELSRVIRVYLQDRFGFNASELTGEQLLKRIGDSGKFSEEERKRAAVFFSISDRVKFGGYIPTVEEQSWSIKAGEEIIHSMEAGARS
jgi:hypothetical protein